MGLLYKEQNNGADYYSVLFIQIMNKNFISKLITSKD